MSDEAKLRPGLTSALVGDAIVIGGIVVWVLGAPPWFAVFVIVLGAVLALSGVMRWANARKARPRG